MNQDLDQQTFDHDEARARRPPGSVVVREEGAATPPPPGSGVGAKTSAPVSSSDEKLQADGKQIGTQYERDGSCAKGDSADKWLRSHDREYGKRRTASWSPRREVPLSDLALSLGPVYDALWRAEMRWRRYLIPGDGHLRYWRRLDEGTQLEEHLDAWLTGDIEGQARRRRKGLAVLKAVRRYMDIPPDSGVFWKTAEDMLDQIQFTERRRDLERATARFLKAARTALIWDDWYEHDWTQDGLAEKWGCSVDTLQRIITRENEMQATQTVIEAIREEAEKTRNEIITAMFKARDGETPAEAAERILAENAND